MIARAMTAARHKRWAVELQCRLGCFAGCNAVRVSWRSTHDDSMHSLAIERPINENVRATCSGRLPHFVIAGRVYEMRTPAL
jgi:hypothetical protein